MEREQPKISIIVPIYLSEPFLHQCVGSLVNQTLKEIEILLVNDGSPDNSLKICEDYSKLDQRVKIINKQNGGAADALNVGTDYAIGDYIIYLDADDWMEPETCNVVYSYAEKYSADIVLWSYVKEYEGKSVKANPEFANEQVFEKDELLNLRRRMIGLAGYELKDPIRLDALSAGWGKLYKKSLLPGNSRYWINSDTIGSSDVFFNIQVFGNVNRVLYLRQFYNHYRKFNANSLTKTYKGSLFQKLMSLFEHIAKYLDDNNLGPEFKSALQNRIALSLINNIVCLTSPDNSLTSKERTKYIKNILINPVYRSAIAQFRLKHLPLHWKVFYMIAKMPYPYAVYIMGLAMQRFRDK